MMRVCLLFLLSFWVVGLVNSKAWAAGANDISVELNAARDLTITGNANANVITHTVVGGRDVFTTTGADQFCTTSADVTISNGGQTATLSVPVSTLYREVLIDGGAGTDSFREGADLFASVSIRIAMEATVLTTDVEYLPRGASVRFEGTVDSDAAATPREMRITGNSPSVTFDQAAGGSIPLAAFVIRDNPSGTIGPVTVNDVITMGGSSTAVDEGISISNETDEIVLTGTRYKASGGDLIIGTSNQTSQIRITDTGTVRFDSRDFVFLGNRTNRTPLLTAANLVMRTPNKAGPLTESAIRIGGPIRSSGTDRTIDFESDVVRVDDIGAGNEFLSVRIEAADIGQLGGNIVTSSTVAGNGIFLSSTEGPDRLANGFNYEFNVNNSVLLDTTASNGPVSVLGALRAASGDLTVNAGTGAVRLGRIGTSGSRLHQVQITGDSISLEDLGAGTARPQIYTGPVLEGGVEVAGNIVLTSNSLVAGDNVIFDTQGDRGALTADGTFTATAPLVVGDGSSAQVLRRATFALGTQDVNLPSVQNVIGRLDVLSADDILVRNSRSLSLGVVDFSGTMTLDAGSNSVFSREELFVNGVRTRTEIKGAGSIVKRGTGTFRIEGNNSYSGPTTIEGGKLELRGGTIESDVIVQSGARLFGNAGTMGDLTVQDGGTVAPGREDVTSNLNSRGTLSMSNLLIEAGGEYENQLRGSSSLGADLLRVTGTVSLADGVIALNRSTSGTPQANTEAIIIENDAADAVTGAFAGAPEGGLVTADGFGYTVGYARGDGNDVSVRVVPPVVEFSSATFSGIESSAGVTVTRNRADQGDLTVSVNFTAGTATVVDDFQTFPVFGTFTGTATQITIQAPVDDDSLVEGTETIVGNFSNTNGATVGAQSTTTLSIADNDSATISVADFSQMEGNATNTFSVPVTLSNPVDLAVGFTPSLTGQTATAGSDFTATAFGQIQFAANTTSVNVPVEVLGDTVQEMDETLALTIGQLQAGGRAVTFADDSAVVTIVNDDSNPILLTSQNPADGATGIEEDSNFSFTFNQPIQLGAGNIIITRQSDGQVLQTIDVSSGAVTLSGTQTVVVDPPNDLPNGTVVQLQFGGMAVTNSFGNIYNQTSPFTYTTCVDTTYVDQAGDYQPANPIAGQTVTWRPGTAQAVSGLTFGLNAHATVANGVALVCDGGTVNVGPGVFTPAAVVRIEKGLTIQGSGAAETDITGGGVRRIFDVFATGKTVRINDVTLRDGVTPTNSRGGAVRAGGLTAFELNQCEFLNNRATAGGSLWVRSDTGITRIYRCLFDGSEATDQQQPQPQPSPPAPKKGGPTGGPKTIAIDSEGGALHLSGPSEIYNSTFINNRASNGNGGAIYANRTMDLRHGTIISNTASASGGGVFFTNGSGEEATLRNSIVAGNSQDLSGQVVSGDGNFIGVAPAGLTLGGNDKTFASSTATTVGDLIATTLADNGGVTRTLAVVAGGEADGAALAANVPAAVTTDQRGTGFARVVAVPEMGAFEIQNTPPTLTLSGGAVRVECGTGTYSEPGFTATDAQDGNLNASVVVTGGPVDPNVLGPVTLTYTVTDAGGLMASATRVVTVADGVAPVITRTGPASVTILQGSTYNDEGATITDSCDNAPTLTTGNPVDTSMTGTYTVTYNGMDLSGNTAAEVTRTVEVVAAPGYQIAATNTARPEGNAGTQDFIFTVTRTDGTFAGSVNWAVELGGGVQSGDFVATTGVVTFAAGSTSESLIVQVRGDLVVEANETFQVQLSSPAPNGATITTASAPGTIQNDDAATLTVSSVTAAEGTGGVTNFDFTVTLSQAVDVGFSVQASVVAGTATAGDFSAAASTLNFAGTAGEQQGYRVNVAGDAVVEAQEQFAVQLGQLMASGRMVSLGANGAGVITNDDSATLAIAGASVSEGDSGSQNLELPVTLAGTVDRAFTIAFSAPGGGGTLNFAGTNGEVQNVTIPVPGDLVVEPDETFAVSLGTVSAGGLPVTVAGGSGQANGVVQDNDRLRLTIADVSVQEGDSGSSNAVFSVTADRAASGSYTVNFATSDGSATAGSDYTASSGTLMFAGMAGEVQMVTVPILGDLVVEPDEDFGVTLSNLVASAAGDYGIGRATAMGTIRNNDGATLSIAGVTVTEGNSGTVTADFVVTSTAAVSGGFTVDLQAVDGTAVAGSDFTATNGTLTFAGTAGETQTVSVVVLSDAMVERDETFEVLLSNVSNAGVMLNGPRATGTITNDDATVVSIAAGSVLEGGPGMTSSLELVVSSSAATPAGFAVDFAVTAGTATEGSDFSATSGTLNFGGTAGETQQIMVPVAGDAVVELNETVEVVISLPLAQSQVVLRQANAVGTITNDDSATISVAGVTVTEGDNGTQNVNVPVTLSGAVSQAVPVSFAAPGGTGMLTFAGTAGEVQNVVVAVPGDRVVEPGENLPVSLTGLTNNGLAVTIGTSSANVVVQDNDALRLAVNSVAIDEGDSGSQNLVFTVTADLATSAGYQVNFATSDGTATAGDDYTTSSGTLMFAGTAGETQTFSVPVLGDQVVESEEAFEVALSNLVATAAGNYGIGQATGTGTIRNDDGAGLSITGVTVAEGASGTTTATFEVMSTLAVAGGFEVDFATSDGTAVSGSDYTGRTGTLTFAGTENEKQTIEVAVLGDTVVENDETFFVTLGNVNNPSVTVTTSQATGTITNDDATTVAIANASLTEGTSGASGTLELAVTSSAATPSGFAVEYVVSAGTATAGLDYSANNGTLNFSGTAGEVQRIPITVNGDALVEFDETVTVAISLPVAQSQVAVGQATATGTITNDDAATVSIAAVTVVEGDSGTQTVSMPVTLTGAVSQTFTVPFLIGNARGTLTFSGSDGETRNVRFAVDGDRIVEPDEVTGVTLTGVQAGGLNVILGAPQANATVTDDDALRLSVADVSVAEGDSGTVDLVFAVTADLATLAGYAVDFATADGTATSGVDFAANSGRLTFAGTAGEVQTVTVTVNGDSVVEPDEDLALNLFNLVPSAGGDYGFGRSAATGTIRNDDGAGISIADVSQVETDSGSVIYSFEVMSTSAVVGGFTVDFSTQDGTATSGTDYTSTSGTLTFTGNENEVQTIAVTVLGDDVVEPDEVFSVVLSNVSNPSVTLADDTGVGTITNNDATVVSIASASVSEGSAGTTSNLELVVSSTKATPSGFEVGFTVSAGTATDGVDFASSTGILQFAGTAGETQRVVIPVTGDAVVELDETVQVVISAVTGSQLSLGQTTAVGTITNDDVATLSIASAQLAEGNAGTQNLSLPVTLTGAVSSGFTVGFSGTGGISGVLSFGGSNGEVQSVVIPVAGDLVVEPNEEVSINLGAVTAGGLAVSVANGQATGTVLDDDQLRLSVADVREDEGDAGTRTITFAVVADRAASAGYAVDFSTADGSATSGVDYVASSGTVTFSGTAGETQDVSVVINGDTEVEPDETFELRLANLVASAQGDYGIGRSAATGTIGNDDGATLSVADVRMTEGTGTGAALAFEVVSNEAVVGGFTVDFSLDNGTAVSGVDFAAQAGTLTFAGTAGETQRVEVSVVGDELVETDETLELVLSNLSNASVTLTNPRATGTIVNDDATVISIADATIAEGAAGANAALEFSVVSSKATPAGFEVDFSVASGTAQSGGDFTAASGTLQFTGAAAGESQRVTVNVVGDGLVEFDETLQVTITGTTTSQVAFGRTAATGMITNDDTATVSIAAVTVVEGDSGTQTVSMPVTLTGAVSQTFTVPFLIGNARGTLTFSGSDGETRNVRFAVDGDRIVEPDEVTGVTLTGVQAGGLNVILGAPQANATVTDDDALRLSVADVSVAEGDSGTVDLVFAVTADLATLAGYAVDFATADGTATSGVDFAANSGRLTFAGTAGEVQTVTVTVNGDSVVEPDEDLALNLFNLVPSAGGDYGFGRSAATGTIRNDDGAGISIADVSQVETDSGSVIYSFEVMSTSAVVGGFTVDFSTQDGTATSGTDYTSTSGTLTFTGNENEVQTIAVTVLGDDVVEPDEVFSVVLSNVSNPSVTLADDTGVGTITNNDATVVSIASASVSEGSAGTTSNLELVVSSTKATPSGFEVGFTVSAGTATDGVDFASSTGILQFAGTAGETQRVVIPVTGDAVVELDETVQVVISTAVSSQVRLGQALGTGTIRNDDAATLAIAAATVVEGNTGRKELRLPVTLTGAVSQAVQVNFSSAQGSGTLNFTGRNGEVRPVVLEVTGDEVVEPNEEVRVTLSNLRAGGLAVTLNQSFAIGTITDDDVLSLKIASATILEGNSGTVDLVFAVTADRASAGGYAVDFATSDDTATAGADYEMNFGRLTFAGTVGETQNVVVRVNGDREVESDEELRVTLSNLVSQQTGSYQIGTAAATGTIENDDASGLSITGVSVTEGNQGTKTLSFEVTNTEAVAGGFQVDFATENGTALAGSDFVGRAGTLRFVGTRDERQTIDVVVSGDVEVENDETFEVVLSNLTSSNLNLTNSRATGRIVNDDATTVSVADAVLIEGDSGSSVLELMVSSTSATPSTFDINYVVEAGSAEAGTDYTSTNGTLTFRGLANEMQAVPITVLGDLVVEADETVRVTISMAGSISQVTLGRVVGTGTIRNDDGATVSINDVTLAEGDSGLTEFVFTVTSSEAVAGGFSVDWDAGTSMGTGVLNFAGTAGETRSIIVEVPGDEVVELDQTFEVRLLNVSRADVAFADNLGVGTIENDDEARLTISDTSVLEGDAGPTGARFTVTLDSEVDVPVSVAVGTDAGSALENEDFLGRMATVTFAAGGARTAEFEVAVNGDRVVEVDENFFVRLSPPSAQGRAVTVADGQAEGVIRNDDGATVSINDVVQDEGDAGMTDYVFEVTSNEAVAGGFTVDWASGARTGRVRFVGTAGEVQQITIAQPADEIVELDERFEVRLSGISAPGVTFSDDNGEGTVRNDDQAVLSVADVRVTEGDTGTREAVFVLQSDRAVDVPVKVMADAVAGTATIGVDFLPRSESLELAAGQRALEIRVPVAGDEVVEADETLFLVLSQLNGMGRAVSLATAQATATIENDDRAEITITGRTRSEGDVGDTNQLEFFLALNAEVQGGVMADVRLDFADGQMRTEKVTFSGMAGQQMIVQTPIVGDAVVERDEQVQATITGTSDANVTAFGSGTATGTVRDDDVAQIRVADVRELEGDSGEKTFEFVLTATNAVAEAYQVVARTVAGTATEGGDFLERTSVLDFQGLAGEEVRFGVQVVGDRVVESDEVFSVMLDEVRAAGLPVTIAVAEAMGTIRNDDGTNVSVSDARVVEGGVLEFEVVLEEAVAGGFSVDFETPRLDTNRGDFESVNGSLQFVGNVGEKQVVRVQTRADNVVELDELVELQLSNPSAAGVTISGQAAVGIIINDDQAVVSVDPVAVTEGDRTTTGFIVLSQSQPVDVPVRVTVVPVEGSARAGSDFENFSREIVLEPGSNLLTFFNLLGDNIPEEEESFLLEVRNLRAMGRAVRLEGGADTFASTVVVTDDDAAPVAGADGPYQVVEDSELVVSASDGLLQNDTDADDGAQELRVLRVEESPANGTVTVEENGGFRYVPRADFFGIDRFRYIVSDGTNEAIGVATIEVRTEIDLGVGIEVLQRPLIAGGRALTTFRVRVVNNGPSDATRAVFEQREAFPQGVQLISATPERGSFENGRWLFDLAEGETTTLLLVVEALEGAPRGADAIPFAVELRGSDQNDTVVGNNAAQGVAAVAGPQDVEITSTPYQLDRQTGLFVGTVTLRNTGAVEIPALHLFVRGLPAEVSVFNATGQADFRGNSAVPYLLWNRPLPPSEEVTMRVEFFQANLRGGFVPEYAVELLPAAESAEQAGEEGLEPTKAQFVFFPDGTPKGFLIEIPTEPGARYAVEYSDDMQNWVRVAPILVAPADQLQWIDNGPPKTVSFPDGSRPRFYRFLQLVNSDEN